MPSGVYDRNIICVKKPRYCKNAKCDKGLNRTRKIMNFEHASKRFCCYDCKRINKNLPLWCQNPKCNKGARNTPQKLRARQRKYCSHSCNFICNVCTEENKENAIKNLTYRFEKGHIPWNKNKTKETDERLRESGEKVSKTLTGRTKENNEYIRKMSETKIRKYASGEIIAWKTGLTKETDEKIAKSELKHSETLRNMYASGELIPWQLNLTKETDERIARAAEKTRIWIQKRIDKLGGFINIGRHEKQILDEIEKKEGITINRKFKVRGYYPDGYCRETNTIYEVYERGHESKIERDEYRQKEIEKELNCKFVIIWDTQRGAINE